TDTMARIVAHDVATGQVAGHDPEPYDAVHDVLRGRAGIRSRRVGIRSRQVGIRSPGRTRYVIGAPDRPQGHEHEACTDPGNSLSCLHPARLPVEHDDVLPKGAAALV